ncbi:hypothetical protein LUW74_43560 [Actinomadura madurae]|uniref:hypothetical protein n=1 Tax=Actinomadura madurae TaxID=1993 RepID=UPI0020274A9A|nr:hypothetical protein [Actinomadura madurae]URN10935.1 hypothetical protein LUW74_43560 [Actinomadura madurae]
MRHGDHRAAGVGREPGAHGVPVVELPEPPAASVDVDVAGQDAGEVRPVNADGDGAALDGDLVVGASARRHGQRHRLGPLVHTAVDERAPFGDRRRRVGHVDAGLRDPVEHRDELGKDGHRAPHSLQ